MNFSEPFVRRPVATVLLTVGVGLLGLIAYRSLPIASLPLLERPTITVDAFLPGASADTIAPALTSPLERQLGLISGLAEMTSSSISHASRITLEFGLDTDIDAAAGAVQAAINTAGPMLPLTLPQPPRFFKANPNGFPIAALALTSDAYNIPDLYAFADTIISQKLSQIDGVARIFISGAGHPSVRIQVNPRAVADMKLSIEQVRFFVKNATADLPKGSLSDGYHSIPIIANDQLYNASDFRDIVLERAERPPIHLREIANISDATANENRAGWFNGRPAIVLYVLKKPDANVVETVDEILKTIPQLRHWIPASVDIHVVYNRTLLIRAAITDVKLTMASAIVLVVMVLALFLRRFWTTIIPSATIPVAIASTLVAMYFLSFSLDNISLMALTIAVGFVIDDSVIIIENITRLIESGETPINAALNGTRKMGFTVISITVALVAALVPILFMPDIVGRLFREFGLTLIAAITTSAVVSLTLTPMLCGRLLSSGRGRANGRFARACEGAIARCSTLYATSLTWILRHHGLALLVAASLAVATVGLYIVIPKGFLPTQDTGIVRATTIASPNISFAKMSELQRKAAAIIQADPAVADVASYVGDHVISIGTMLMNLKPPDVRKDTIDHVIGRLREKLAHVNGLRVVLSPVQDLTVGTGGASHRYQYVMSSLNQDELVHWARVMLGHIRSLPQATDVVWNYDARGLGATVNINRARAAEAGTTVVGVDNVLYDWFGQRPVSWIRQKSYFSHVVLEVQPQFRENPLALPELFLQNGVPLQVVSDVRRTHSPTWIRHFNQLPAIAISFNTPRGVSIGEAEKAIKNAQANAGLPSDIKAEFSGMARLAEQNTQRQPALFLAAVIAIYIILGILYESYAHPLTILSTLPSAAFGALLAMFATHTQFTVISAIACILVVGIVMKNAIMMVDFALDAERHESLSASAAIQKAALLRLRPIVMTTMAALLGALPLALGTGVGHELRQPLGIALVGGLFFSQFVTLYTTPAVYLAVDKLRRRPEVAATAVPDGAGFA
jgi:hydrophobe/amphiphile efflux-1 (HAE1) family protein